MVAGIQRLARGALLALISSGLTVIYGTLGVLNLAHGAMFMIGGYAGYVAFSYTGSFIAALLAGSAFVLAVGLVMERAVIRHFYDRPHEDQILVTFGLGICFVEIIRFFFGSLSRSMPPPPRLSGITSLGFMIYPTYRIAVVAIIAISLLAIYLVLSRTRLGMIVRAGIEDTRHGGVPRDQCAPGIHDRVRHRLDGRGLAGIVNLPVAPITPDMGDSILVQAFVVIVIGGEGSYAGAVLGGLIAGEILSISSMIDPAFPYVALFAVMTVVLMVRPRACSARNGGRDLGADRPRTPPLAAGARDRRRTHRRARRSFSHLGFVPDTMSRILVLGLFGIGFDLFVRL